MITMKTFWCRWKDLIQRWVHAKDHNVWRSRISLSPPAIQHLTGKLSRKNRKEFQVWTHAEYYKPCTWRLSRLRAVWYGRPELVELLLGLSIFLLPPSDQYHVRHETQYSTGTVQYNFILTPNRSYLLNIVLAGHIGINVWLAHFWSVLWCMGNCIDPPI